MNRKRARHVPLPVQAFAGYTHNEAQFTAQQSHTTIDFNQHNGGEAVAFAAAMAAFDVIQEEQWRIEKLHENFTYMRDNLRKMGFELGKTDSAVIPIYIRQDLRTIMMWKELLDEHGIYTNPFITPGVPPKQQMLRTSYMATHEREHLDRALEAFEKAGKKFGVLK